MIHSSIEPPLTLQFHRGEKGIKAAARELLTVHKVSNVFADTNDPSRPNRNIDA